METTILFLLTFISAVYSTPVMNQQGHIKQKNHNNICTRLLNVNNIYYALDERRNISGIPADMSIHWKTDKLYFTLISDEMRMSLQVMEANGQLHKIKVTGLGQSTCVDNLNDIVYLATDNGVYKYKEDGSIDLYSASGEDVMYVAVNREGSSMYTATWPQNRVQKITNDGKKQDNFPYIPNGHGLTIDSKNNIYFVATKTSYILKNDATVPIKIKGLPNDKMTGVFVTKSNEVFAMDENSNLYIIEPDNTSAKYLGTFKVDDVNSFAMDSNDNVLIGIKGAILKFDAYEENPCPEQEK